MKTLFTLLMLALITSAHSQLSVDPTFNSTDHGGGKHNAFFGGDEGVTESLVLPNGKILAGGFFYQFYNAPDQSLALLNADGSIDPSFNAPGEADDMGDGVNAMALQTDGKIIIGGYMSVYHGENVYHLMRIYPNGDLDTSFHSGLKFISSVYEVPFSIAIQPDGKIIVGGDFTKYEETDVHGLVRINADGSLDTSFNFSSDTTTRITQLVIEPDGKIMAGGTLRMQSDNAYKNLVRLKKDGSLDKTFYSNGDIVVNRITFFDVQADNSVVFACDSSVYRVNNSGAKDSGFIKGEVYNDLYAPAIYAIKIQPDGKILLGGRMTSYNGVKEQSILRLNTDGTLDNSFSTGIGFGSNTDGGTIDNNVSSINLLNDGRIFITGGFLFYRGVWQATMAMLNNDGSINNTFNADNGNGADANVNKIILQPDNKILIAGDFSVFNGVNRNKIARLNSDGTLDNSFNPGTGPDSCNYLNTLILQNDGKILAGGNFTHFNGASKSLIVRLNDDGSIDNNFTFSGLTKNYGDITDGITVIAVQNDKKIIVGLGASQNYITHLYNYDVVKRLNADGSLDNSFNANFFNSYPTIYSIQIQPDGKILVAGDFTINNSNKINLVRLNSNGSLDASFNSGGIGPDVAVFSANLQTDGKIIISGDFQSYNSANAKIIARLNIDGSLDTSYKPTLPDSETNNSFIDFPISIINKTIR